MKSFDVKLEENILNTLAGALYDKLLIKRRALNFYIEAAERHPELDYRLYMTTIEREIGEVSNALALLNRLTDKQV